MINKTDENFAVEAVLSINPKSGFSISETYESLLWHSEDIDKPTKSEFDKALAKIKSDWEAKQYQRDRIYPPIGDQLDALYHAGVFPKEMSDKLKAVKEAHPKPE